MRWNEETERIRLWNCVAACESREMMLQRRGKKAWQGQSGCLSHNAGIITAELISFLFFFFFLKQAARSIRDIRFHSST